MGVLLLGEHMNTPVSKGRLTLVAAVAAALTVFAPAAVRAQGTTAQGQAPPASAAPSPVAAPASTGSAEQQQSGLVIRKESRLVLVDAVVTDKKGAYVHDLTQKDFKVYEDNKEQQIASFSAGSDVAVQANNGQRRYLILFFDNSSMAAPDQIQARGAAKFVDANAGPDRMMAVVDFGGTLRIVQNFTANADALRAAVSGVKTSYVARMPRLTPWVRGRLRPRAFRRSATRRRIMAHERCYWQCAAWRRICGRCPAARCWFCFPRDSRLPRRINRSLPPQSMLATKPMWRSIRWTCAGLVSAVPSGGGSARNNDSSGVLAGSRRSSSQPHLVLTSYTLGAFPDPQHPVEAAEPAERVAEGIPRAAEALAEQGPVVQGRAAKAAPGTGTGGTGTTGKGGGTGLEAKVAARPARRRDWHHADKLQSLQQQFQ